MLPGRDVHLPLVLRGARAGRRAADPAKLTDHLWLGSRDAAADKELLEKNGISHIANVADDVDCFHKSSFKYLHLKVEDGGRDGSIVASFQEVTDFVREARDSGGSVLVHCFAGINRSATVAMAALVNLEGWTLEEAYNHTERQRTCIFPMLGNRKFIAKWELETRGQSSMPDWLPTGLDAPSADPFFLADDLDFTL